MTSSHHPPPEPHNQPPRSDTERAEPHHEPPTIPGLDITGPIANGGHSVVYLARQENHDRPVAVKVLNAALDDTARRRFDRERATLGRVSTHPAVIGLFDSGVTADGRAYLVLEWAPNGSLAEHLAIDGPMSPGDVTALGICLAGALEHAHRSGVMHRDIKPSNIVRSEYGDWLLTDFSVAAFDDPRVATDAIQVSLAHCAPESFSRPDPSASADVYSLASVLATALTGAEPNAVRDDETLTQAIARVVSRPVPPLPRSVVGERLGAALDRALSHDVADRQRSMRSFAAELAGIRRGSGLAPIPFRVGSEVTVVVDAVDGPDESPASPRPSRRHRRHRPNRIRPLVAAVFAVVVLGGVYATAAGSDAPGLAAAPLEAATTIVSEPIAAATPADTTAEAANAGAGSEPMAATATPVNAIAADDAGDDGGDRGRDDRDGDRPPPNGDGRGQPPESRPG